MGHLHAKYACSHLQIPDSLTKPLAKRAFTMFHGGGGLIEVKPPPDLVP